MDTAGAAVTGTVSAVSEPTRALAFFDDRFHEVYGAQENLLLLAELCAAEGHRCQLVTSAEGALSQAARERGLDARVVAAPPQLPLKSKRTLR